MSTRQQQAYSLVRRASKAQIQGQFGRAVRLCRASLHLHPTAEAYTILGWLCSLRGDFECAIALCRKAIRIDPSLGNPYSDIGAYLIELDRFNEAIPWLRKATSAERYISCHAAHFNMARIYEHLGDPARAIENYRIALVHCPDSCQALKAYWRLIGQTN